jgi:hypothetical protein
MKWLGVIKLRSPGKYSRLLEELLLSIHRFDQSGLVEMKTFRHAAVESDWSIHLHW